MPHTSKKYKKVEHTKGSSATYIVVAVIVIVIALAGGWYAYSSFVATTKQLNQSTSTASASNSALVYAKINTSMGLIEVELFKSLTPITVSNFVSLANSGFYNNLVWHRIMKNFVIQTGDPYSRNGANRSLWGSGGSPNTIPLEIVSSLHNYEGYMSMARLLNNPSSGSSQFFINLNNNTYLDGNFTIFGKVISGMNVALAIGNVPVNSSDQPIDPVYVLSITVVDSP